MKYIIIIAIVIILLLIIFKLLSKQGSNPSGFGGRYMLKRWSKKNERLYEWTLLNTIENKPSDILDLGIGQGASTNKIAYQFKKAQIVGIDRSKDAISLARLKNKELIERSQVGIILGDVHNIGLKKESFDLIYALDTILYWEDLECALNEVYKLMKKDASFIIGDRVIYLDDGVQILLEDLLKDIGFSDFRVIEDEQYIMYQINK